ncbi:MAG: hypothetical protein P1P81_01955 [Desulfobulbales bacterium]|nr:hypothetical protein [Desulfobulbales bacterium]
MRQLLIDDLSCQERDSIETFLKRTLKPAPVNDLFWLGLPDDLLGESQRGHKDCGPFYFAVELGRDSISFELLVRSAANLHCSCINYADRAQRDFVLAFVDRLASEEKIRA